MLQKKRTVALIVASIIIVAGSTTGILLYTHHQQLISTFEEYSVNGDFTIQTPSESISHILFVNELDGFDFEIASLSSSASEVMGASWTFNYTANAFQDPLDLQFSQVIEDETLRITLEDISTNLEVTTTLLPETIFLAFNPAYYNFSIESRTPNTALHANFVNFDFDSFHFDNIEGEVWFNFTDCDFNGDLFLRSDAGRMKVITTRGTFLGDLSCITRTRDLMVDFWDPLVGVTTLINITASENSATMNYMQHTRHFQEVNIVMDSLYHCDTDLFIPRNLTEFQFYFLGEDGHNIQLDDLEAFTDIQEHAIESHYGYTGADLLKLNMTSRLRDVFVHLNPCFKPQRYCAQLPDLGLPIEHYINGTVDYAQEEGTTTDLQIINYIPNMTIDQIALDAGNSNYVNATWDLEYWKGGGLGTGDIEISVDFEVNGTTLIMYLRCEYDYDFILPYFHDSSFIIGFQPSLTVIFEDHSPIVYVPFPDLNTT